MEKLTAKRCYELLDLAPGATLAQIREQRGKLAQQWHPDTETDPARKARLEEKMKDINNAFDFLRAFLSGTLTGQAAAQGTPVTPQPPAPAKRPWEAEADERRRKTAEREAAERREEAARKRAWKAEFQRVQADAARQRAQQQADAARLQAWLAQEKERQDKERQDKERQDKERQDKERQEQGGKPRDRRLISPPLRREADPLPSVRPEAPVISRPREPRPPARVEAGKSRHIYHSGKCTKCGRSKEQIAGYGLDCL